MKTYEVEMEQDKEIEKSQKKGNSSVALVASGEDDVKDKGKAQAEDIVKMVKEENSGSRKAKRKMVEEADFDEDNDGIDQHLAFLSKRFSKLKFKKSLTLQNHKEAIQKLTKAWLIDLNSSALTVDWLVTLLMNEESPKLRKSPLKMWTTRRSIMSFLSKRKGH